MENVIELRQVGRQYTKNRKPVWGLRELNLSIHPREVVSIIGPSGCGKTTLLKMIGGILETTEGEIRYRHGNIKRMCANGQLGYVPQFPALLPNRNVLANVCFPLEIRNIKNESFVIELLSFTGLTEFSHHFPHQLSGGMKQKVAIVRALVYEPEILLMDEPFSALDEMMREKLDLELLRIHDEFNKTIVFVTHNIEEAVFISDRIVVLSPAPGRVIGILTNDLGDKRTLETKQTQTYFDQVNAVRTILRSL